VEAVYPDRRRIRITHGPIDALAWPAMTMEFDVLGATNLDTIQVNQNIRFSLAQQLAGDYAIIELGTESERTVVAPQRLEGIDQPDPNLAEPETAEELVAGTGIIIEIGLTSRILKLKHEPIEAVGWPAMTMNFDVADGIDLAGLEKGQSIRFILSRSAPGNRIEEIEVLGGPAMADEIDLQKGSADQDKDGTGHGAADHD
jgi:Cu/Ag efflux protein CusF